MYKLKEPITLLSHIGTSTHKEKYYVLENTKTGMIERLSSDDFSKEYIEKHYGVKI